METALLVLLLFLLAFAGLAVGLLLGRSGVRGGCGGARSSPDCSCAKEEKDQPGCSVPKRKE